MTLNYDLKYLIYRDDKPLSEHVIAGVNSQQNAQLIVNLLHEKFEVDDLYKIRKEENDIRIWRMETRRRLQIFFRYMFKFTDRNLTITTTWWWEFYLI